MHRAFVERGRPVDDRVKGDRAFAKPQDHRVAPGLDPLGDGDFALAAKQFDRAHFAQVHPHRIIGAVDGFLLLGLQRGGGFLGGINRFDLVVFLIVGVGVFADILIFDDIDAHFIER